MLSALTTAARSSDLVIAWGDLLTDAAITAAQEYPRVRFILHDAIYLERLPSNVIESSVWDGEQAFLAGAVAAIATRSGRVGYLGALPGWQHNAFRAGVFYVNPRVGVIVDYIATTITAAGGTITLPASWRIAGDAGTSEPGYHDARKAEEVSLAQFDLGTDVIYTTVGTADAGTYQAAVLRHRWVIGRGGPHSLSRLREPWRGRTRAIIVTRGDVVVHHLVSRVVYGLPLKQHVVWRNGDPLLRDPALPVPIVGVILDTDTPPIAGMGDRLSRIMDDLRDGLIGIPYSTQQLGNFYKRYAR